MICLSFILNVIELVKCTTSFLWSRMIIAIVLDTKPEYALPFCAGNHLLLVAIERNCCNTNPDERDKCFEIVLRLRSA